MERIKLNFLQKIILMIFPRRCAVCAKIISADTLLCDDCFKNLHDYSNCCPGCLRKPRECNCKLPDHVYDNCVAAFSYDGDLKESYKAFKFRGDVFRGEFFINSLVLAYNKHLKDMNFDFVCAVPGSHAKRDNGGYLPTDILAKGFSKAVGLEYNDSILKKVKKNSIQHKLKFSERRANVRGVYLATEKIRDKRVLLIDDIRTSGATLDECTRELKFAGAYEVATLTVFAPSLEYANNINSTKTKTKVMN